MSALGGTIAFILGSIMLMRTVSFGGATLSIITIITMTVLTVLFFGLITVFAVKALQKKVVTGSSGMTGRTGTALEDLSPRGTVMISGEIWKAKASPAGEPIRKDDEIIVESIDGLIVIVKKSNAGGAS
jgi:membrane-bound serine protease (ClpP class)